MFGFSIEEIFCNVLSSEQLIRHNDIINSIFFIVNKYLGMNKSIICHDFQKDIAPNGGLKSRPPDYVFNALPIALQINT